MDGDSPDTVDVTEPPAPPVEPNEPAPEVKVEGNSPDETWSPPKFEEETGIALDGHGLPLNHRLRAERLADAGKDEDPGGLISPELIADAGDRLAAERKARPPVAANMKVPELERIAKREGIDISSAAETVSSSSGVRP